MASEKISQLPAAANTTGPDLYPIVQSGANFSATFAVIQKAIFNSFARGLSLCVASFGGNAMSGRYLEFIAGQSSDQQPFPVLENSNIVAVTLLANVASTGVVAIYKASAIGTSIQTIALSNQTENVIQGLAVPLNAGDELVAQVISGSIQLPQLVIDITRTS